MWESSKSFPLHTPFRDSQTWGGEGGEALGTFLVTLMIKFLLLQYLVFSPKPSVLIIKVFCYTCKFPLKKGGGQSIRKSLKIPPEAKKQKSFINHSWVLSHTHHWDPHSWFELRSLAELLNFPSQQVNITHFTPCAWEPWKFSWHFKINCPFRL